MSARSTAVSSGGAEVSGRRGVPEHYDVLVLDASIKQSLASVRSLARAGLRVAAAESIAQFDPAVPLPTFWSRYCARAVTLPDLVGDTEAFVGEILDFVSEHSTSVVLPTGDITIGVLRPYRQKLAELGCFLALAPEHALEIANDKDQTLTLAQQLGIAQPRTIRIGCTDELESAGAELGWPFVLKPTVSWAGHAVERLVPVDVIDLAEATEVTQGILDAGAGVLAQEWAPGRREGVTLFIAGDEVLAACGHVAHRTSPPLGGASVLRESIKVPDDMLDAAVRLAKQAGLQGVCEVEFRRDARGRPLLMEINARLAGTIENAVRAGVDFPLMIWCWATGLDVAPVPEYRTGVRTRWLHGDIRWLWQNWKRGGRPDSAPRVRSLYVFISEFAKSFHYDYFDWGDVKPFLAELRYTIYVLRGKRNTDLSPRLIMSDSRGLVLSDRQVAIIGAGPFGLSISAHLSALGIDHVIAGRPMDTWRSHMPDGMLMKSEPYASTIASPDGTYDVATYSRSQGLDYVDRMGPLTRERFLDYADWYTGRLVPGIREDTVTDVSPADGKFRVTFARGAPVTVRQVVVATGVLPYRHLPAELAGLSADLVTHSADHDNLDEFKGRRVAVIGAGQSALETAALLNEVGADVQVVARTPKLSWNAPNPEYLSALGRVRRPVTQLCEGWRCAFWYTPRAFRLLPEGYRITKAPTVLGPAGAWWLRDRIEGAVDVLTAHAVRDAAAVTGGVRLTLDGPRQSVLEAEHVIAGTGFRVDIARLPFLPETLRSAVKTLNGYVLVSRMGETSVPGLYFTGASTLLSIGPSARFIAGTHSLCSVLAKSVARHARAASN